MLAIVAGRPTPMPTPSAITLDSVKPFEGGGLFDNGFPVSVAFEIPIPVAVESPVLVV
jgi:hypothetical protein